MRFTGLTSSRREVVLEDILEKAREYRRLALLRADAHYGSAEWHRFRGVKYGVAATLLSATVSSTIFVAMARRVGVGGETAIVIPTDGWGWTVTITLGVLLVLSPAITGVTTYLNDPDQAQRHITSAARYFKATHDLDLFILRYSTLDETSRTEALTQLQSIASNMEAVAIDSITLTPDAIRDARSRLGLDSSEEHPPVRWFRRFWRPAADRSR